MACEMRLLAYHVHGKQADIDFFFELVEMALEEAEKTLPGQRLEFLDIEEGEEE